ncbi:MAG TPA: hypothetical protein PLQ88_11545 [Blastocatellia bacterium]|nr:hypothetical protein [Blastocatellia bacterium]
MLDHSQFDDITGTGEAGAKKGSRWLRLPSLMVADGLCEWLLAGLKGRISAEYGVNQICNFQHPFADGGFSFRVFDGFSQRRQNKGSCKTPKHGVSPFALIEC